MDWIEVAKVAAPLASTVGPLAASLTAGAGGERRALRADVEIAAQLPDGPAKTKMLNAIERNIVALHDPNRRRDVPMLVVSLILAPLLCWGTIWLLAKDGWLWTLGAVLAGTLALMFVYGIFETAQRIPRNEKGIALPTNKSS